MFEDYPEYLSTEDCCALLSVEQHAIYQLISNGELEAIRLGGKNWRISKESLIFYTLRASGLTIDKEDMYDYI